MCTQRVTFLDTCSLSVVCWSDFCLMQHDEWSDQCFAWPAIAVSVCVCGVWVCVSACVQYKAGVRRTRHVFFALLLALLTLGSLSSSAFIPGTSTHTTPTDLLVILQKCQRRLHCVWPCNSFFQGTARWRRVCTSNDFCRLHKNNNRGFIIYFCLRCLWQLV